MSDLRIDEARTRYRVTQADAAEPQRIDELLRVSLGTTLATSLRARGVAVGELCIRQLRVQVRLPARASESEILARWADATALAALDIVARGGDEVVVYGSLARAFVEAIVAQGGGSRSWAWSQLGLLPDAGSSWSADARLGAVTSALLRAPSEIVPVLRELSRLQRLSLLLTPGSACALPALARVARALVAPGTSEDSVFARTLLVLAVAEPASPLTDDVSEVSEVSTAPVAASAARVAASAAAARVAVTARRSQIFREAAALTAGCAPEPQVAVGLATLALLEVDPGAFFRDDLTTLVLTALARRLLHPEVAARPASDGSVDRAAPKRPPPPSTPERAQLARNEVGHSAAVTNAEPRGGAHDDPVETVAPAEAFEGSEQVGAAALPAPFNRVSANLGRAQPDHAAASPAAPSTPSPATAATQGSPPTSGTEAAASPTTPATSLPLATPVEEVGPAELRVAVQQRGLTLFGGLLFLLHVLRDLDLARRIALDGAFEARTLPWCLHQLGFELVGPALTRDDPALLAFAGVPPTGAAPCAGEPPVTAAEREALQAFAREVSSRAVRRLSPEPTDAGVFARLLTRDAEIVADAAWFDVHFSVRDVSLELRRAGLDWDPGFVPWLGTVVRFHYV